MSSQNIRKLVTTALLIALSFVFQQLRPVLGGSNIISTYIIGSLVNLCLIIAATAVGLWSGVAVSVITPLIALLQGHAALPMLPWIIAGNAVLAVLYTLFSLRDKTALDIVLAALGGNGRHSRAGQVRGDCGRAGNGADLGQGACVLGRAFHRGGRAVRADRHRGYRADHRRAHPADAAQKGCGENRLTH